MRKTALIFIAVLLAISLTTIFTAVTTTADSLTSYFIKIYTNTQPSNTDQKLAKTCDCGQNNTCECTTPCDGNVQYCVNISGTSNYGKAETYNGTDLLSNSSWTLLYTTSEQYLSGSQFDCSSIIGGHKCSLSVDNNLGENARIVFIFTNSQGLVVATATATATLGTTQLDGIFYCSEAGDYSASWFAYRTSDATLSNSVAWSLSTQIKQLTCV